MTADPIVRFRRWFRQAERARIPLAEAMVLATADGRGTPSARFVLLKGADSRGFVFYTDSRSRKGRELRARARAALVFYWHALGKQVRIEGRITEVTSAEADAYWESRPRESRLAALASTQSAPLARRSELRVAWQRLARQYRGKPIPRPSRWTGFRVVPQSIEFWTRGEHRLHYRERFTRHGRRWRQTLLQP